MTSVLVHRAGALGDVLLTTPIVAQLREMLGPDARIDVETGCPQAYENNPHVSSVNQSNGVQYDRIIDLDMAYENNPSTHIVEAYYIQAFGHTEGHKRVVFGIEPPAPRELAIKSRIVTLHATRSWPSRAIPEGFWDQLVAGLLGLGYQVEFIGHGGDYRGPNIGGTDGALTSFVGGLSLRETANHIAASCAFVASDSALLHLAGATDTPIIGLFTSVKAEYRLPWRQGVMGLRCAAVTPRGLECYGCLADERGRTSLVCKRGDNICATMLDHEDVIEHVKRFTI